MNSTTTTAYYLPGDLQPPIEFLPSNTYHLFVDGRWTDSFCTPEALLQSFRVFAGQAHACTAVTGGEVDFYCRAGQHTTNGSISDRKGGRGDGEKYY